MTTRAVQSNRFPMAILLATFAILAALMLQGNVSVATAGGGCANANSGPDQASKAEFARSITCLINRERTSRGLDSLENNSDLKGIQTDHIKVMLDNDCFRHRCAGESSLRSRLFESGYLNGVDSYRFAENLGYEMTPNEMIDKWMASDYHRGNILNPKFEDLGVAADFGSPKSGVDDEPFVTYSTLFAWRKP